MFLDIINFSLVLLCMALPLFPGSILSAITCLFIFFLLFTNPPFTLYSPLELSAKKKKTLLKYLLTLAICSSQSPTYSSQLSHLVSANHHVMVLLLLNPQNAKSMGNSVLLSCSGVSVALNRIERVYIVLRELVYVWAWYHTAGTEIWAPPLVQTSCSGHHNIVALPWKC